MPDTYIYPGAIVEMSSLLDKLDKKKILLVTGKKSYEQCGAKHQIDILTKKYSIIHFDDFQTNPDSHDLLKGISLFNDNTCDFIISIGGGSSIDMAKLINYYYNSGIQGCLTDDKLENLAFSPVTHLSIPTTAGSGSEATHFAVIYINKNKYSIADQRLKPDYVIIDPELHYSQSDYQKAVSGADALSQCIESLWSLNSTDESKMYAERGLKLIWENLPKEVNGGDEIAHLKVAIGAHLAGKAINISKTTAPHALSYSFTTSFKLAHGHAVSLFVPFFLKYHKTIDDKQCVDKRGKDHVFQQIRDISSILSINYSTLEYSYIDFLKRIGIIIDFKSLNINKADFMKATQKVNIERLNNNPGKIDKQILHQIFEFNNVS